MKKLIVTIMVMAAVSGAFAKPKTVAKEDIEYFNDLCIQKEEQGNYLKKFTAECGGMPETIIIFNQDMLKVGEQVYTYEIWGTIFWHSSKIGFMIKCLPIEGGKTKTLTFSRKIHGAEDYTTSYKLPKSCTCKGIQSGDGHMTDDGWVQDTYFDYFDVVFETKGNEVSQVMWYRWEK